MNIIYFGNRNYWDIEKYGHTRYEQIFKSLVRLNKHKIIYTRVFRWRTILKHIIFYLKNIFSIRIKLSFKSLIVLLRISDKLYVVSIYSNLKKDLLPRIVENIKELTQFENQDRWIWFNNPLIWNNIRNTNGYKYYFDTIELWLFQTELHSKRGYIKTNYHEIANNINMMTCHSDITMEYFYKLNSSIQIFKIKNGVNLGDINRSDFSEQNNNRTGFKIGTIGVFSDEYDYEMLINLALKFENIKFIFIGKIFTSSRMSDQIMSQIDRLFSLDNVIHLGYKNQKDLFRYVSEFNVGLIPYKTYPESTNNYWKSRDTLKKYQYWAYGLKVISSKIEDIDDEFKDYIIYYEDQVELNDAVSEVYKNRYEESSISYDFIKDHDWDSRVKEILKHIENVNEVSFKSK